MADEKRYLDYDGLSYLVEKLTNRIQAVGGDGKYLPLTGGTLTGGLTVGGQTTLNDDLTLGGSAEINLKGENRINVGGNTEDTFPDFAQDFWYEDYGARLLLVGNGMVHSVSLKQLADWIVSEVVGSGGGTTSVFWHLARYDWEMSLRNSADETLSSPLELGLIFADNPYTGLEAQSCPDDCSIVWAQLRSSVPTDYDDDLNGDTAPNLDFAKRWFVGLAVRADALFDVSLNVRNQGEAGWIVKASASRTGASGSSEWGFVPIDAPVDFGALDLTGDGATFEVIVTGDMVMRSVN